MGDGTCGDFSCFIKDHHSDNISSTDPEHLALIKDEENIHLGHSLAQHPSTESVVIVCLGSGLDRNGDGISYSVISACPPQHNSNVPDATDAFSKSKNVPRTH